MKKAIFISREIIASIAIIVGAYYLILSIPTITSLFSVAYMKDLGGKIFIILPIIGLIISALLIITGAMLVDKYTPKAFVLISVNLCLIFLDYIAPLLGIGQADKGYYKVALINFLPLIVINILLFIICYVSKAQERKNSL